MPLHLITENLPPVTILQGGTVEKLITFQMTTTVMTTKNNNKSELVMFGK